MSSAHRLTEINSEQKFNENRSKGKGDMERTKHTRVIPTALNCDLDLESAWLSHGFAHYYTEMNI